MTHNDPATENPGTAGQAAASGERADLLAMLARTRHFMRFPARGLTDEQARHRSTASELSIGGLIKHVTAVEEHWAGFIVKGPSPADDIAGMSETDWAERADQFRLLPGETLAGALARYEETAARTDELVTSLPGLGASHPLPRAPWYQPGERWSARRVLMHIIAETAQHAGHADIIRETIDGARTMG